MTHLGAPYLLGDGPSDQVLLRHEIVSQDLHKFFGRHGLLAWRQLSHSLLREGGHKACSSGNRSCC
jgi:hypothetical protein